MLTDRQARWVAAVVQLIRVGESVLLPENLIGELKVAIGDRLRDQGFADLRFRWMELCALCDRVGKKEHGMLKVRADNAGNARSNETVITPGEMGSGDDGEGDMEQEEEDEEDDEDEEEYQQADSPRTRRGRTTVKTEKTIGKQKDEGSKKTRQDLSRLKAFDGEIHARRAIQVSTRLLESLRSADLFLNSANVVWSETRSVSF